MMYTLSWFTVDQKPSDTAHEHHFRSGSLVSALDTAMDWWRSGVDSEILPVEDFVSHRGGVYAYLSDDRGLILAYLLGIPFKWEVRQ